MVVPGNVVAEDQSKAHGFQPREIGLLFSCSRDGQVNVENWLSKESGNHSRSNMAHLQHLVLDGALNQLPDDSVLLGPTDAANQKWPRLNLSISDPSRLTLCVGR